MLINFLGVIAGFAIFIHSIIYSKQTGNIAKIKFTLLSGLCALIAIISWFLNFGWLRFFMTFLAIPTIHTIAFLFINDLALTYIDKSAGIKRYSVLSYITYLAGYIFLPDGGDTGSYSFFGLIHNNTLIEISFIISSCSFILNAIILVLQIIERIKIKKTQSF